VLREPDPGRIMQENTERIQAALLYTNANTLFAEADPLLNECFRLVRHRRRRSTLAWQRALGPAFVVNIMKLLRGEIEKLPHEISGHTLGQLLVSMRATLSEEGSEALRSFLAREGDQLTSLMLRAGTIDEFIHLAQNYSLTPKNDPGIL
jgi:hypothetical protein